MNNATARPTKTATARPAAATTTAKYFHCLAYVWGTHPVLVRATDGLMIPCTGSAPRRGEPVCNLPANWRGDGYGKAWAKPLSASFYTPLNGWGGKLVPVTNPAVIAAADKAFGLA